LLHDLDALIEAEGNLGAFALWFYREFFHLDHAGAIEELARGGDEAIAPSGELEADLAYAAKH
jgi:hypothetical protein